MLAVEDRRFYSHWGIDPIGIARAIVQNYRRGRIVEGGSTITQQLTKVLFLTPDKSLERKLKEAVLALELERRYSKDRILEMYLNQVYFGHGAYGVEAAARTYFAKSVSELNVREAALLAGLPRAPTSYSPFEHPQTARLRRDLVLRRMVEFGVLNEAEAKRLVRAELGLISPERRRTTGPYFLEFVQQTLEAKYGADMVFKGGLNVYTTLNPWMQLAAEQAVRDGLKALEGRTGKGKVPEQPEGALVTIDPATGHIKALVGGYDFFRSEFNRAVAAKRQPGSAFKPFIYIAALESGFTAATRIDDSPVSYPVGRNGSAWKPENYDRKFRGVDHSAAGRGGIGQRRDGQAAGADRHQPHRAGGPANGDHQPADPGSHAGAGHVGSLPAGAHLGLQHAGQPGRLDPADLHPLSHRCPGAAGGRAPPRGQGGMSPETAYVVTHMLMGVVERGTGQGARVLARPIAAKTGTTNDYSNAWFIGFTPRLATGVWVGYDRPRSLGKDETGSRVAVPIWTTYMQKILGESARKSSHCPRGWPWCPSTSIRRTSACGS